MNDLKQLNVYEDCGCVVFDRAQIVSEFVLI